MLKYKLNQLDLTLECNFDGPFLIKDGQYVKRKNSNQPDAVFIKRSSPGHGNSHLYYVPGSSIRGLFRSHAEKIIRTKSPVNGLYCCDPFDIDQENNEARGCTKRLPELKKNMRPVYKYTCMACKLFGAGGHGSRISFSDGELSDFNKRVIDGVGIDRFTGGSVQGAKFQNEVLEKGFFKFKISLRNFEIWQLGLLAFVLRDLENGELKLGFGKSKGFGAMTSIIQDVIFTYWRKPEGNKLAGVADMLPGFVDQYGAVSFIAGEEERPDLGVAEPDAFGMIHSFKVSMPEDGKASNSDFWKACAKQWIAAINASPRKFLTIDELHDLVYSVDEENIENEESIEQTEEKL